MRVRAVFGCHIRRSRYRTEAFRRIRIAAECCKTEGDVHVRRRVHRPQLRNPPHHLAIGLAEKPQRRCHPDRTNPIPGRIVNTAIWISDDPIPRCLLRTLPLPDPGALSPSLSLDQEPSFRNLPPRPCASSRDDAVAMAPERRPTPAADPELAQVSQSSWTSPVRAS